MKKYKNDFINKCQKEFRNIKNDLKSNKNIPSKNTKIIFKVLHNILKNYFQIVLNCLFLTIIIYVFLYCIFKLNKGDGSIFFESDKHRNIILNDGNMNFEIKNSHINIKSFSEEINMIINCGHIETVDGVQWFPKYTQFYINLVPSTLSDWDDINMPRNIQAKILNIPSIIKIESFDDKEDTLLNMKYINGYHEDSKKYEIIKDNENYSIEIKNTALKEYEFGMHLERYNFCVTSNSPIKLSFEKYNVTIRNYMNQQAKSIPIKSCIIYPYTNVNLPNSIQFFDNENTIEFPLNAEEYNVEFDCIKNLNLSIEGSLFLNNTANIKEFVLKNQNLKIFFENSDPIVNSLILKKENENSIIICEGKVNDVTIADYSIFPDFMDWIKDNIYIIPSMLLTIFGGAITLTVSNNKNSK